MVKAMAISIEIFENLNGTRENLFSIKNTDKNTGRKIPSQA
jgi:hypothetical protein